MCVIFVCRKGSDLCKERYLMTNNANDVCPWGSLCNFQVGLKLFLESWQFHMHTKQLLLTSARHNNCERKSRVESPPSFAGNNIMNMSERAKDSWIINYHFYAALCSTIEVHKHKKKVSAIWVIVAIVCRYIYMRHSEALPYNTQSSETILKNDSIQM